MPAVRNETPLDGGLEVDVEGGEGDVGCAREWWLSESIT